MSAAGPLLRGLGDTQKQEDSIYHDSSEHCGMHVAGAQGRGREAGARVFLISWKNVLHVKQQPLNL